MLIKPSDCARLGTVAKTHGVDGAVVIRTDHNLEKAEFEEPVFVVIDGLPVPLFFEEIVERTRDSYIAKFEMIDTPERAKELVGCEMLGPRRIVEQDHLDLFTQVRGLQVIDANRGPLGVCTDIEPIPGNPLLVVERPDGEAIYIPFATEWVRDFVPGKRVTLECPEGLDQL